MSDPVEPCPDLLSPRERIATDMMPFPQLGDSLHTIRLQIALAFEIADEIRAYNRRFPEPK